jgi:hypothetical protein
VAFHLKHADMKAPTFILVQYHPPGTASSRNAELRLYRGEQAGELALISMDVAPVWACNLAADAMAHASAGTFEIRRLDFWI